MYRQTTHDIEIVVEPTFLTEQSDPDNGRWFWAYQMSVSNRSNMAVQLVARHWEITDAAGQVEIVDGPGVVGEQPIIGPGGTYNYTSGCPLNTPSGTMVGHYIMEREDGMGFAARIPAFSLDLPGATRVLN